MDEPPAASSRAITKSGTNQFHGSAYEFLRNNALDAAEFLRLAATVPPFRRNQYGGSAGGPIQKDKTFIFGDYEGVSQGLGTTSLQNVPSTGRTQRNPYLLRHGPSPFRPLRPLISNVQSEPVSVDGGSEYRKVLEFQPDSVADSGAVPAGSQRGPIWVYGVPNHA